MDISIIIPAYNENKKIAADIFAADNFLKSQNFNGEIILVDDGSKDDTAKIAEACKTNYQLKVIKLKNNVGKGGAVIEGVKQSVGDIILYADSGLTVPFDNSLIGINFIKSNKCEIANGSRKITGAKIIKPQDIDRKIISRIFGIISKLLLKIPKNLTDTQCGFKVYKGDVARKLFPQITTTGFLFEIEIVLLAKKENYKILEFPVIWTCDRDSRISIRKSSKKVVTDFIYLYKKFSAAEII